MLKLLGILIFGGFMAVGGFFFGRFYGLADRVETADVYEYMDYREPVDLAAGKPLNVLLIGNDSREGEANAAIGGLNPDGSQEGMRSDTTIVAHVSADRKRVEFVSIPRDSIVQIPSCERSDGTVSKPIVDGQFNWAFSQGDTVGASVACTIKTLEENAGITIDSFAVVDFIGFQQVIDAMGGVPMTITEELRSDKAGLHLQPGEQILNGAQALGFARARTFEIGPEIGSDLERIERQQELMGAVFKQLMTPDVLFSPVKIMSIAEGIMSNLTVSPELSDLNSVVGFIYSLRDYTTVEFITIPNEPWEFDRNRVIWTAEADGIWEKLNGDIPLMEAPPASEEETPAPE